VLETCETSRDPADPLEEFQSALIRAYEHALEQGISPSNAVAAMLELTSLEIQRWVTPTMEE
jgi:hypothetical protein